MSFLLGDITQAAPETRLFPSGNGGWRCTSNRFHFARKLLYFRWSLHGGKKCRTLRLRSHHLSIFHAQAAAAVAAAAAATAESVPQRAAQIATRPGRAFGEKENIQPRTGPFETKKHPVNESVNCLKNILRFVVREETS